MPPIPKTAATRQRTNKVAGARSGTRALQLVHDVVVPRLPSGRTWHRQTKAWWKDVWASPMAPEYDSSDLHGLILLAVLVDEFWIDPSKELAGEIRLQRQCFGLTPIDRRRLQWEIDRGEEAATATEQRRAARPKPRVEKQDPRRLLA